jgi:hypothetical protein
VSRCCSPSSRVCADSARCYTLLTALEYEVEQVNHGEGEYALGDVHENTAECEIGLLQCFLLAHRGIGMATVPSYLKLSAQRAPGSGETGGSDRIRNKCACCFRACWGWDGVRGVCCPRCGRTAGMSARRGARLDSRSKKLKSPAHLGRDQGHLVVMGIPKRARASQGRAA